MNLYTYKVLYLGKHQDHLAEAAEARLVKLAQENLAKTNQKFPKFIDDFLQKVGQRIVDIYYRLYQRGKSLNLKKIMIIRTRHYNDVAILAINGRLDSVNAPQLLQTIKEQVVVDNVHLVIDLKKVDFLNSVGIKVLMQGAKLTWRHGGDIRLANAQMQVKYVLNLAGVSSVIKVFPNVVCATASYFPDFLFAR